jgi:hypothetical protein
MTGSGKDKFVRDAPLSAAGGDREDEVARHQRPDNDRTKDRKAPEVSSHRTRTAYLRGKTRFQSE